MSGKKALKIIDSMRVLAIVLNHKELKSGMFPLKILKGNGCSERFAFVSISKKPTLKNWQKKVTSVTS